MKGDFPAPRAAALAALAALTVLEAGCARRQPLKPALKKSETFFSSLKKEPESLRPIRGRDYYSAVLHHHVLESLLARDLDTYEWQPALAEKWEIKDDGKTLVFHLRKNLKWSDGRPLSARDVQFSFEAYKNPEYGGLRKLAHFEALESAKAISGRAIAFRLGRPYFGSFQSIAEAKIIPRHIYQNSTGSGLSKTVIGSGPYKMAGYIRGKMIILTQNPLWAGRRLPHNRGKWNFKNIVFRFVPSSSDILLGLQKGDLDFGFITPEGFYGDSYKEGFGRKHFKNSSQQPSGGKAAAPPPESKWSKASAGSRPKTQRFRKIKTANKEARPISFIGLNLKNPLFQDRRSRAALSHLMNRDLMSKKLAFGQLLPAAGPWQFWSFFADASVRPLAFDPEKAAKLLRAAGWRDKNRDGVLEKSIKGREAKFSWTALFSSAEMEKFLTFYQEDLKKAGIEMKLKRLDMPSLIRAADSGSFEAAAWIRSIRAIDFDPKPFWHSESARPGGYNFIGYSNPKADELIERGRGELDRSKRAKIFRRLYRVIAEDIPCVFMFHSPRRFYGLSRRIHIPKPSFNYGIGQEYWRFRQP